MPKVSRKLPTGSKKLGLSKKAKEEDDTFTLPTAVSEPSNRLSDYSIFLFGEKKIGKTTLLSMFPDALFLMTEPGGRSLRIFQTPITSWRQFRKAVLALKKDKKFKTIIVDTVDILFKLCDRFVCDKLGVEHVSEEDWGKGWAELRKEFEKWIVALLSLEGKGVVFVSHAIEKKIKRGRNGPEYDRMVATLSNQGRDIIEGIIDLWLYYTYDDNRRVLIVEGDEHVSAGHRLTERFKTPKGKALKQISMGTSKEEAYKNFIDAFHNRYVPPPKPVEDEAPAAKPIKKKKKV